LIGGGLAGLGGYLSGKSAADAAATQSAATLEAARLGAEQAAFRPVGMTTGFGSSQFQMNPETGRLESASYQLTPEMQGYFQSLMGTAGQNLGQYAQGAENAKGMFTGSQRAMDLGNQYLAMNPQEQAAQWMAKQQALLAPQNEKALANVRQNLFNTGRSGLAMGATSTGMQATNPEMAAYYNALAQQNAQLAANAQEFGQNQAKFGLGLIDTGGGMLGNYYNVQNQALSPFQTALGAAQGIDTAGQQALDIGRVLGAGNQDSGSILARGGANAAESMYRANSWNPVGNLLQGAGQGMMNYNYSRPSYQTATPYTQSSMFNPYPTNQYAPQSSWGSPGPGESYGGFG